MLLYNPLQSSSTKDSNPLRQILGQGLQNVARSQYQQGQHPSRKLMFHPISSGIPAKKILRTG